PDDAVARLGRIDSGAYGLGRCQVRMRRNRHALAPGFVAPAVIDAAQRVSTHEAVARAHTAMWTPVFPYVHRSALGAPHRKPVAVNHDGVAGRRLNLMVEADCDPPVRSIRHGRSPVLSARCARHQGPSPSDYEPMDD